MKAKFKPQNKDRLSIRVQNYAGKVFNFRQALPVGGVKQYFPDDLKFTGSPLIPETDLEFEEEQLDVYCGKCSSICKPVFHLEGGCL